MLSYMGTNVVFNEVEFFTYMNMWLLSLLILLLVFFILMYVTLYSVTSFKSTDSLLEIFVTLGSLIILFLMISPSLLLLFDTDITMLPNTVVCMLGMQWAWESTIKMSTNASTLSFFSMQSKSLLDSNWYSPYAYSQHTFFSFLQKSKCPFYFWWVDSIFLSVAWNDLQKEALAYNFPCDSIVPWNSSSFYGTSESHTCVDSIVHSSHTNCGSCAHELSGRDCGNCCFSMQSCTADIISYPLNTTSSYLIMPFHSMIKTVVGSRDVIHSYGMYSFGCKMDAIPGRFNLAFSMKPLIRGMFRGFCFELCGTNHTSMIMNCLSLNSSFISFIKSIFLLMKKKKI